MSRYLRTYSGARAISNKSNESNEYERTRIKVRSFVANGYSLRIVSCSKDSFDSRPYSLIIYSNGLKFGRFVRCPSLSPSNSALSTERYSVVSLGKRSIKIWLISLIKEFRMVRIKRLRKKLGSILDLASDIYGYTLSIKLRKYLERLTNGGNSIIPLYLGS